jgi:hypothetical protein
MRPGSQELDRAMIWIVLDSVIWRPPRKASSRCAAVRAGENEDEILVVVVVAVAKHGLLGWRYSHPHLP